MPKQTVRKSVDRSNGFGVSGRTLVLGNYPDKDFSDLKNNLEVQNLGSIWTISLISVI